MSTTKDNKTIAPGFELVQKNVPSPCVALLPGMILFCITAVVLIILASFGVFEVTK